jgi:hypothetical protein
VSAIGRICRFSRLQKTFGYEWRNSLGEANAILARMAEPGLGSNLPNYTLADFGPCATGNAESIVGHVR